MPDDENAANFDENVKHSDVYAVGLNIVTLKLAFERQGS